MEIKKLLERGGDYYLPHLSIDQVIIGYEENTLKCLLLKIGDKWLLPGGYIGIHESVESATHRILKERTGFDEPHLQFLAVFGHEERHFGKEIKASFEEKGIPWRDDYWINKRFITLAYYALVYLPDIHPVIGQYDEAVEWFPFNDLPKMWMDHRSIVMAARERLKDEARSNLVIHHLLSGQFTMPELHQLNEVVLEEKIDRSRFQKKMLASGKFKRLEEQQNTSPGRNPYVYTSI